MTGKNTWVIPPVATRLLRFTCPVPPTLVVSRQHLWLPSQTTGGEWKWSTVSEGVRTHADTNCCFTGRGPNHTTPPHPTPYNTTHPTPLPFPSFYGITRSKFHMSRPSLSHSNLLFIRRVHMDYAGDRCCTQEGAGDRKVKRTPGIPPPPPITPANPNPHGQRPLKALDNNL